MEVLEHELSHQFDLVFKDASEAARRSGKSIVFKYTYEHPNPRFHERRGIRETISSDKLCVYLKKNMEKEEFEKTAVHELCHEIIRAKGFDIQFKINRNTLKKEFERSRQREISDLELRELEQNLVDEATYITNCFTHIPVSLCMKQHGYDIGDFDKLMLDKIQQNIYQRKQIDKEIILLNACNYISHIYQEKYSCSTLNVARMKELYKKWNPQILQYAKKLMHTIRDVDILDPKGCYKATKTLRDAMGRQLGVDLASYIRFRNPETGNPE